MAKRDFLDVSIIHNIIRTYRNEETEKAKDSVSSKHLERACGANYVGMKISDVTPISEIAIVKPYLEELKAKMRERDEDNGGEPLNAVDRGYHLAYEHLCEEIDDLLNEV